MKKKKQPAFSRKQVLALLRQNKSLLDKYAVKEIALFGSYAKDTQSSGSDIDLLVQFEQPTYDNFIGLTRALEKLFHKRVEILTPDGLESIRVPVVAEDIKRALAYG